MSNDRETLTPAGVGELVRGIVDDAQELTRQQLALFRHELCTDFREAREAGSLLMLGLPVVLIGAVFMGLMAVHLLSWGVPGLPLWAAYAIVGSLLLLLGGTLSVGGMRKLRTLNPPFDQSTQALRENIHG